MSVRGSYDRVIEFWNQRAGLGEWAGTRDVIAKRLEIESLAGFVTDGMRILDVGCGNGITAMEIARRFRVKITGIDFSPQMVAAARGLAEGQSFRGQVDFSVGKVPGIIKLRDTFDLIYTERTLINLPDWPEQQKAIREISSLLAPGALYLMCENSQNGLDELNALRVRLGLKKIEPPWHNRYLMDEELESGDFGDLQLERVMHYSSTYYFLSRVVNAWLAEQDGREPEYDSPINQLALQLPPIGTLGQGRLWVWRRHSQ